MHAKKCYNIISKLLIKGVAMAFEYDDGDLGLDEDEGVVEDELDNNLELSDIVKRMISDEEDDFNESNREENEESERPTSRDKDHSYPETRDEAEQYRSQSNIDRDNVSGNKNETGGRYGDMSSNKSDPDDLLNSDSANSTKTKDSHKKDSSPDKPHKKPSSPDETKSKSNLFSKLFGDGNKASKKAASAASKAGSASTKKAIMSSPYFWIAVAAVAVIFILILMISILSASAAIEDQKNSGTLCISSITNEYFYGMRLAYSDDDILSQELQLSYKQYAIDILNIMDEHEDVEVTISLPAELDNPAEMDQNIINISIAIGNIVANGHTTYENIEFSNLYKFIPYFGLSSNNLDDVCAFLIEYISDNSLITISNGSTLTISELVNRARNDPRTRYISNLCEKVIIQDVMTTNDGIAPFGSHQFVGAIYMPKRHVIAKDIGYIINFEEDIEVKTSIINKIDSAKYEIASTEEDFLETPEEFAYSFQTFESIDVDQPEKYSEGISLFNAVKAGDKALFSTSFDKYTWIPPDEHALYLSFESNGKFQFNELIITCKDPYATATD